MKNLALALLCIALASCATARKAVCPAPHIGTITETEHTYVISLEAACRTEIVVVAK